MITSLDVNNFCKQQLQLELQEEAEIASSSTVVNATGEANTSQRRKWKASKTSGRAGVKRKKRVTIKRRKKTTTRKTQRRRRPKTVSVTKVAADGTTVVVKKRCRRRKTKRRKTKKRKVFWLRPTECRMNFLFFLYLK